MITSVVIQILFWWRVLGCILGGLGTIVMGLMSPGGWTAASDIVTMFTGGGIVLIDPLVVRIEESSMGQPTKKIPAYLEKDLQPFKSFCALSYLGAYT